MPVVQGPTPLPARRCQDQAVEARLPAKEVSDASGREQRERTPSAAMCAPSAGCPGPARARAVQYNLPGTVPPSGGPLVLSNGGRAMRIEAYSPGSRLELSRGPEEPLPQIEMGPIWHLLPGALMFFGLLM